MQTSLWTVHGKGVEGTRFWLLYGRCRLRKCLGRNWRKHRNNREVFGPKFWICNFGERSRCWLKTVVTVKCNKWCKNNVCWRHSEKPDWKQHNMASGLGGLGVACWPLVPTFAGSNAAEAVRIFQDEKILSTPSFGGEAKPSVSCRRFAACKRSLNGVEVVISAKLPEYSRPHNSTFCC